MRVLLIHNLYQQAGGEDAVFEAERKLLMEHGHNVETVVFDNRELDRHRFRIMTGMFFNRNSRKIVEQKIREFLPDIVHVHNFIFVASPSIFYAAATYDVPTVMTLHNYRLLCPSATLLHNGKIYEKSINTFFSIDAILKGVYRHSRFQTAAVASIIAFHELIGTWKRKVDRYIVLSDFGKDLFGRGKFAYLRDKITIKSNFVADTGMGTGSRQPYFLFIGRLTEEKGIRTLLEAATTGRFRVVIGGDGPLRSEVEEYAGKYHNILYRGSMARNAVIDAMKTARALIFPSQWYEGFPVTILEAFCSGTPVIASAVGSMQEIVKDDWNGRFFKPGDVNDLVRVIGEFPSDNEQAIMMQLHARQDYVEKYHPSKNYTQLMRIYKDAIASHRRSELETETHIHARQLIKT